MQKLLRRSPSGPIVSAAGKTPVPSFLSLGFNTINTTFLSLGFKTKFKGHTKSFLTHIPPPMPSTTTLNLRPSFDIAAALAKNPAGGGMASRFLPTRCCRICRCAIDNRDSVRAWVVLKERESRSGSRSAWFHTAASDKGFQVAAVAVKSSENLESGNENGVVRVEEKSMRLHRRQKGVSLVGEALLRNPDLLTIPGVGQRNLRKLVENGITGVAELKQLYKDKVLYTLPPSLYLSHLVDLLCLQVLFLVNY